MIADFEKKLQNFIEENTPDKDLAEVLLWSTLPAGKLFRPKIFYALLSDLNCNHNLDARHIAFALELHHAYTLVHDDLPCMDNDEYRRGKLSTHAKYGEWKAVLAGDALLNLSYHALSLVKHKANIKIIHLFTHNLGGAGLILGQWLDLSVTNQEHIPPIEHILRIHHLKTGQLIATALNSAALLSDSDQTFEKIGFSLGICFQLLDDLSELNDPISEHEKNINPFLHNHKQASTHLLQHLNLLKNEVQSHSHLLTIVREYLTPMKSKISSVFAEEILKIINSF
jgi:geranylgeranyl pyrophosphate synthase